MHRSSPPPNLQDDPEAAWMMEIGKSQRPAAEKLLPINSKTGVAAARNRLYSHHSVSTDFISCFAVETKSTDEKNEPNRQWLTPINTDKVCYLRCWLTRLQEVFVHLFGMEVLPGLAGLGGGFDICKVRLGPENKTKSESRVI